MIKKIKDKFNLLDEHTLEVIKKSSGSLIVKVSGMGVSFFVSIFIARTLGAAGTGIINLVSQIISFLVIICVLGFSQIIIKEVAIAYNKGNFQRVKDVLFSAYVINGAVGVLCTVFLILFSEALATSFFKNPDLKVPLIVLSIALIPQIVSKIMSAALVGYKRIWQSNLIDQTLNIGIVSILLLLLWILNVEISVIKVAIVYAIASLCVTISGIFYWRHLNKNIQKQIPIFLGNYMIINGLPLLIVSTSLFISTSADTFMLGWLRGTKEVGVYTVASKLAMLTSFFLQISISTMGQKIAVMFKNQEIKALEQLLQRVTTGLIGIGFLSLIFFIFLGKYILNIWGYEFILGYPVLVILTIGQFFNIASGPVGTLLVMTNHQKILRNITVITVLFNLILNYFLIKNFGAMGAAIATAFTTILNMGLSIFFVRKKTGLKILRFLN